MWRAAAAAFGVVVLGSSIAYGEKEAPLPKAGQGAERAYAEAKQNAARVYNRSVTEAHSAYLASLERAIVQETKAGHLDAAVALRDRRDAARRNGPPLIAAIDWVKVYKNSAKINAIALEPIPLKESNDKQGWQRVPAALQRKPAIIYMSTGRDNGVADFEVVKDGIVLLACSYNYQGNSQGDWQETRWTKEQFMENGWTLISSEELDGVLVGGTGQEHTVFMKQVRTGEKYRLRCNKYEPPHVIVFP